ncbi:MAG: ATP-binding protein, partial [Chloroflexi bacterium]|nr:ATP-binding protein [Chloroflexota bacterium]
MPVWIYVFLPYSLAFLALGLVMAMTARSPVPVLPRAALWLLAGFGFTHGLHEWVELATIIQQRTVGDGTIAPLQLSDDLLTAISYVLVMQAGLEVLIRLKRWPEWSRVIPGGLFLAWAISLVVLLEQTGFSAGAEWVGTGDASARNFIGLFGSLIAAYAILVAARAPREIDTRRIGAYLTGAAVGFVFYAIFTAVGAAPASFPPASWVNEESFLAATGIPPEALRALFALAIAGFLAEACVVEAAWLQADMERLREEFVSMVAHDLRTPITTIGITAEMLERLPSAGHTTEREFMMLGSIKRSTRNLSRMVEDLMDASRIEAQRLTLRKEHIDLRRLICELVDRSEEITKAHPVRVALPDTLPPVEGDPGRIEQVLVNLLSNAEKYSYPGTDIEVMVETKPSEEVISVKNYGPGIAPGERPLIFT